MRILLVTQKLPLPLADGYNLRIHHYARILAERHRIALFALEQGTIDPALSALLAEVTTVPVRPLPRPGSFGLRAAAAFSPAHLHDYDPAVERALRECLAREAYDLVWVSGWKMLPYMRAVQGPAILGDIVDEGAKEAWVALRRARRPAQIAGRFRHWWRARAFSRRYFRLPDLCLFVAEADAAATARLCPGLATAVVHNGVDAESFRPLGLAEEGPSLVFEGGLSHVPNAEGVLHFCRAIWPRILAELPEAHFWIVGRDPPPEVRALAGPAVHVTGFVEDVRPYLARANVFVSPLVGGAGIKNKILQAWAMAKPVVCTSLSAGGLRAESGHNLVIADEAGEFARACVTLLRDPRERERLGRAGRETVLSHYGWETKAREIEQLCERLVEGRRAR